MIVANFNKGTTISQIFGLWQYDYGQVLRIQGLNLPTAVEIHFSYQRTGGEAKTRIGMTKDGVTDVVIPDSMLENQDTNQDYKIYAFVYVTDDSSGQTEYCITMNVQSRPKPEAFDRPEDGEIFKEAIQAVRESADQAEESARQAWLIKDSVQDMVDTIGSIDEQVQAVKEFAQKAETASSNAASSESRAKESETAAESARQQVAENKTAVEQAVSGFDEKVSESNTAIESAKTEAVKAVEDKGNEVLQSIPPDFETQMGTKLDKQQGVENKGKALVVGEDGNVVPGEVASGGGDGIAIINTRSGASPLVIPDSAERVNKGFGLIGNTEQSQNPPPSPDNPQEIKNVGKWNEEKQKYEVDVRFTNAEQDWDKEQTLTLTSNRPITKWDRLVEQDRQIGWLYKSKIISNFDGVGYDIQLGKQPQDNIAHFTIMFTDAKKKLTSDLFVDKYKATTVSFTRYEIATCCNWENGTKYFSSPQSGIIMVEQFKTWLKENPLSIAYETEKSEFVPLSQSEQDAIRALMTYYPTTVITTDGGEVDPNIEVTYTADTKLYIDQKIAEINKAIVTTQKALLQEG